MQNSYGRVTREGENIVTVTFSNPPPRPPPLAKRGGFYIPFRQEGGGGAWLVPINALYEGGGGKAGCQVINA